MYAVKGESPPATNEETCEWQQNRCPNRDRDAA
jgi:hypothetical protein